MPKNGPKHAGRKASGAPKARWSAAQKAAKKRGKAEADQRNPRKRTDERANTTSREGARDGQRRGPLTGGGRRDERQWSKGNEDRRRDDRRGDDRRDDRRGEDRKSFDRRDERRGSERRVERGAAERDGSGYGRPSGTRRPSTSKRSLPPGRSERTWSERTDDRRGGYDRRGDRPFGQDRDRQRGDYRQRDERQNDQRGGYQRRDERSGYDRRDERRDDRGGYERRDDRRPPRQFDRPRRSFPEGSRFEARVQARREPAPAPTPVPVEPDNAFLALGVPEVLVERLARDGITEPFAIQAATIADAMAGKDVLGRARTGSGKTLAFGLPTIVRLMEIGTPPRPNRPRAVVLVPTRELAMQVSDALEPLVHVAGLRHRLVAGGLSYDKQIQSLDRGVDLLIATPGRLVDLMERGAVIFEDACIAVLDEADHMADMGFTEQMTVILDALPAGGQRMLFSATLDGAVDTLVTNYLVDPVLHATDDAVAAVTTMAHHVILVEPQHKKVLTAEIAGREGRTVVFVRTKLGADRVALQLREQGVYAVALHGGLNQGARNRVLGAFKDGSLPVLVATDVAARGIHVDDVSLVLQVDPPADHKDYLHRSGRTARAGESGRVVTLALPHQRRLMERQLGEAGVECRPVRVAPGDPQLDELGARVPSGAPVPEDLVRRLIEGTPRFRRPGGHGGRSVLSTGPKRAGRPRTPKGTVKGSRYSS